MFTPPIPSTDERQSIQKVSAFYMSKYPVTQRQYTAVMGNNPSTSSQGENFPVDYVNWYDAIVFCNRLSIKEGLKPVYSISTLGTVTTNPEVWIANTPGGIPDATDSAWNSAIANWEANGYRLPTEAEWEYACRAGTTTAYNTGANITTDQANFGNPAGTTTPVGKFGSNRWGLYDMHGNLYEWCWDWYQDPYDTSVTTNPKGPVGSGTNRVLRGGSWEDALGSLRSAYRCDISPEVRKSVHGFRVVRRP